MEVMKLPPAAVNYHWLQLHLTTIGFAALKCSSWKIINCDLMRFGQKIKINQNLFEIL